ncbi:hypothetical protein [Pseudomonas serbica]
MNNILSFPKKIARFESSWLLFVKALLINEINTNDFFSIINKLPIKITPSCFHWWESHQVDLPVLARVLGLPQLTIHQAFIDCLISSKYCAGDVRIRHCPLCIDHNYHSTFFQIPWLINCPWHEIALEECKVCSSLLGGRTMEKVKSGDSAKNCSHITSLSNSTFPIVTLPKKDLENMVQWSDATTEWLRKVQSLALEDIWELMSQPPERDWNRNAFLFFRFAEQEIGMATFDIPAPCCEVKYVLMDSYSSHNYDSVVDEAYREDLLSSFRAIRRYFFNRFVRSHKKCFNIIRRLDVIQSSRLDLTVCCGCVIAYFAWMMAYSDFFRVGECVGKIGPTVEGEDLWDKALWRKSKHEILKLVYLKFNDIWAALELNAQRLPQCSILVVYKNQIRINFLKPTNFTFFSRQTPGAPQGTIRYYCAADDFLQHRNTLRCTSRSGNVLVLTDKEYYPDFSAVSLAPSRIFVLADRTKMYKTLGYINV